MGNQIPCYFLKDFCENRENWAWRAKMLLVKRQKFPANTPYLSYLIPSNVTTPPRRSINLNYCYIHTKNPRLLRGFCYFTDPDKPAVAAKSAPFSPNLYLPRFCIVSEVSQTLCLFQSCLVRMPHVVLESRASHHFLQLVLKCALFHVYPYNLLADCRL